MRHVIVRFLLSAAVAGCTVAVSASFAGASPTATAPASLSVQLDRHDVSVRIGERFSFTSTVRNDSDQPMPGLVAHLNVLGLDPDVYVDPEDWSARRTIYLDPLPARGSAALRWDVQAVTTGRVLLYVTATTRDGVDEVRASRPLRVAVAQQRMLNAGGVLPLAVGMPATVLLLMGMAIRRRRTLR